MSALVLRGYRAAMTVLCVATGAAMVGIVLLVLVSVAVRYLGVFPGSLHWTTELTRFAIVWVAMIGSAIALDRGAHVAVDVLDGLPPRARRAIGAFAYLLGVIFLGIVVVHGFRLSQATMRQISPALEIPMGYAYLAIPVGSAIMLLQSLLFVLLPTARNASGATAAPNAGENDPAPREAAAGARGAPGA